MPAVVGDAGLIAIVDGTVDVAGVDCVSPVPLEGAVDDELTPVPLLSDVGPFEQPRRAPWHVMSMANVAS
jgi:hypothetical protein